MNDHPLTVARRWARPFPGRLLALAASLLSVAVATGALFAPAPLRPSARMSGERVVFVGDGTTDGGTYLLLVRQAIDRAGEPPPACINAGVSVDTSGDIRKRLARDVLAHRPTLVVFHAGVHDALRKVPTADYEANLRAIAAEVKAGGAKMVVLNNGLVGGANAEGRVTEYNAVLDRLGRELGCKVADVNRLMRQARNGGAVVLEGDGYGATFEGHRVLARAVLDALGYAHVRVPKELRLSPIPGIVKEWRVRIAPGGMPLEDRDVAALDPDGAGWTPYSLPEKAPVAPWWLEQERKRGFALSLDKLLGPARGGYQGVATLQSEKAKDAFLLTGAELRSAWVNGVRVFRRSGWTGWHAGKERVPVRLRAGRNVLVIEMGGNFFLSVSDSSRTPEEGPP